MSTQRIDIDPLGDTLVILQKQDSENDDPSSAQVDDSSDSLASPAELHLLCSKKHLTSASVRAHKMFAGGFRESIPDEMDGLYHWKFEPIFDAKAFEMVMKIIHGKTRDTPRTVNAELLAGIAAVVDDLQCHDTLWFFAKGWLTNLKFDAPVGICKELAQLILISYVFEDPALFQTSTKTAITCSLGSVPTFGLPIPPKILSTPPAAPSLGQVLTRPGHIEAQRQHTLENLMAGLYDLQRKILYNELGCSSGCRAMLLGALIQEMAADSLYPTRPSRPFSSLSVQSTIASLRKYQSRKYYSSQQEGDPEKHSGEWEMEQQYHRRTSNWEGLPKKLSFRRQKNDSDGRTHLI
ncbi:hypothetical protein FALBO_14481 [Fusarium albosuccineum]|uniref:BTB domain-containing protein n=1 Tax=Fusarium albosuccineum TaxID=1237068 RepID=A0A8H4KYR5_9HYPO|nr:hypothetical protein FALBO_14481 [Fusarium albosuccineum]